MRILFLSASLLLAGGARAQQLPGDAPPSPIALPARPAVPVHMASLSDADFGRLFFAEVDLTRPDLASCAGVLARTGNHTAALEAWRTVALARLRSREPPPIRTTFFSSVHLGGYMAGENVTYHCIFPDCKTVKNMGPPGRMAWHDPADYHYSFQNYPNLDVLLNEMDRNANASRDARPAAVRYPTVDMIRRWNAITSDFVNNNWRIGIPLALNKTRQSELLALRNVSRPFLAGDYWATSALFRQQLLLTFEIEPWFRFLHHSLHKNSTAFDLAVSTRSLAEMVYFHLLWPITNLMNGGLPLSPITAASSPRGGIESAYGLTDGVPNQVNAKLAMLLDMVAAFPEFKALGNVVSTVGDALRIQFGMKGFYRNTTEAHPDGSGSELSYNYMYITGAIADEYVRIGSSLNPVPDFAEGARRVSEYRKLFHANLDTAMGFQVLCKGTYIASSYAPLTKKRNFTSIAFPYHGLYKTRSDLSKEGLFASLSNPRRGGGHESNDGNKIMLEAYGRYMLVANSGEEGWAFSSWSQNTIGVDGQGQSRVSLPRHGAYSTPMDGRWYTSANFDFAESTYRYPYGSITTVQHLRQLVFVKEASLWFVVDTMIAPPAESHSYEQTWIYHSSFPNGSVHFDPAASTVSSRQAGQPNLFLYQSGSSSISYEKYYGQFGPAVAPGGKPKIDDLTAAARGWHNLAGGYAPGNVSAAPTVHAKWTGTGRQTVITALVPSKTDASPIARVVRRAGKDAIELQVILSDGGGGASVNISISATGDPLAFATGKTAVARVVHTSGSVTRELLLGAAGTAGTEIFYKAGAAGQIVGQVGVPAGFHWEENENGIYPVYKDEENPTMSPSSSPSSKPSATSSPGISKSPSSSPSISSSPSFKPSTSSSPGSSRSPSSSPSISSSPSFKPSTSSSPGSSRSPSSSPSSKASTSSSPGSSQSPSSSPSISSKPGTTSSPGSKPSTGIISSPGATASPSSSPDLSASASTIPAASPSSDGVPLKTSPSPELPLPSATSAYDRSRSSAPERPISWALLTVAAAIVPLVLN